MAKPLDKPIIASSDTNLPLTGQPNKSKPSGVLTTIGYDKGQKPPVEEYNWLWDNVHDWVDYLEEITDTHTTQLAGIDSGVAVGSVMAVASTNIPAGYVKCDGSALSRTTFNDLFLVIGTTYGVGNGTTTFNVPDLRGEFIRGFDDGKGVDAGRVLGSAQADELKSHTHVQDSRTALTTPLAAPTSDPTSGSPSGTQGGTTEATGGIETRPRNVAMIYVIKAFGAPVDPGAVDLVQLDLDVTTLLSEQATASLAANGWWKDNKTGLIVQWGQQATNITNVITYPIAFPTQTLQVIPTPQWDNAGPVEGRDFYVSATSTTDFTVSVTDANVTIRYLAIGV